MKAMWMVSLAQLRMHKGRYVSCGGAVVIAVMFIVVTGVLGASASASITDRIGSRFATSDVVVAASDGELPGLAARIGRIPGVESVATDREIPARVAVAGHAPQSVMVTELADPGALRWQKLTDGRWPTNAQQVVVEQDSPLPVGSTIELRGGGTDRPAVRATVVGAVERSALLGASTVFGPRALVTGLGSGAPPVKAEKSMLRVKYAPGAVTGATLASIGVAVAKAQGTQVLSPEAAVAQVSGPVSTMIDMLTGALLVFAAITVVVSALVIANTFSVMVSSRVGELAMLRCVGADARAVRRCVRMEAGVLGAVSSVVGIAGALLISALALLVLGASGTGMSLANFVVPLWVPLVAATVGVVMAVVAASGPAGKATRVSPVAAFAPTPGIALRSREGIATSVASLIVMVFGLAVMAAGALASALIVAAAGAMVAFVAFIFAGRVIIPPMVRGVATLLAAVSNQPVAGLIAANAARYPRRTAATATALIVGIALTSMMVVGFSLTKSSAQAGLDAQLPVDVVVHGTDLNENLTDQVRGIEGVAAVAAVTSVDARVKNSSLPLEVAPRDAFTATVRSDAGVPQAGQVALTESDRARAQVAVGEQITVSGDGIRQVTATVVDGGSRSMLLTDAPVRAAATTVAIRLAETGDANANNAVMQRIRDRVGQLSPTAEVTSAADARREMDNLLTGILVVGLALLAVAIVVALMGLANTVALSVIDRRRENALLRVIGAQAASVRWMLVGEAGVCAVVASMIGVVMGAGFAVAGITSIIGRKNLVMPTVGEFPWWAIGAIVVVGCVAGMASAALPARRALSEAPVRSLAVV